MTAKHTQDCYLEVRGCYGPLSEKGADERICPLHKSAPALLAALKEYQDANGLHHDEDARLFRMGEAAIKLAEGDSK